jgi:hypothetical protein
METEKSPILGSWKNVYLLMVFVLVGVAIGLYYFTEYFK